MNKVLKVGCIPYSSFRIVIIKPLNKSVSSTKQKRSIAKWKEFMQFLG